MAEASDVRTMKLRYAGACVGCERALPAGERAHYLRATKSVRCLACGTGRGQAAGREVGVVPELVVDAAQLVPAEPARDRAGGGELELVQGPVPKPGACGDCGRQVRRGTEALRDPEGRTILCLDCVAVDTVHSLGTPGAGARIEHAKRLERHQSKVRTRHPRLGGVILALSEEPQHVTAWCTGAVDEEEFGRKLSQAASPNLIVLHDRRISTAPTAARRRPRSSRAPGLPGRHGSSRSGSACRPVRTARRSVSSTRRCTITALPVARRAAGASRRAASCSPRSAQPRPFRRRPAAPWPAGDPPIMRSTSGPT
jgi:hypothetical protein